jgi:hypothetical protein
VVGHAIKGSPPPAKVLAIQSCTFFASPSVDPFRKKIGRQSASKVIKTLGVESGAFIPISLREQPGRNPAAFEDLLDLRDIIPDASSHTNIGKTFSNESVISQGLHRASNQLRNNFFGN